MIHKGLDFLRTVDGCWAFALYNKEKNNVIISRDLLGEKHIFYYKNNKEFIFASEASAVVSVIDEAISFNFNEVFTSMRFSSSIETIIKIKKFKPGQTLEINIQRT